LKKNSSLRHIEKNLSVLTNVETIFLAREILLRAATFFWREKYCCEPQHFFGERNIVASRNIFLAREILLQAATFFWRAKILL
jgi:hypothetical protein